MNKIKDYLWDMKYYRMGEDAEVHFNFNDLELINACRGQHNKLGFAYQLAHVRMYNRFPFVGKDIDHGLLRGVSRYLNISHKEFDTYRSKNVVSRHKQQIIRSYGYLVLMQDTQESIRQAILSHKTLGVSTHATQTWLETQLRDQKILFPSQDQLDRLCRSMRSFREEHILSEIYRKLNIEVIYAIDLILEIDSSGSSVLQRIKEPVRRSSVATLVRLCDVLEIIKRLGVIEIELDVPISISRYYYTYVKHKDVDFLKRLADKRRYSAIVCFLQYAYAELQDTLWNSHKHVRRNKTNASKRLIEKRAREHRSMVDSRLNSHRHIIRDLYNPSLSDQEALTQARSHLNAVQAQKTLNDLDHYFQQIYSDPLIINSRSYSSFRKYTPQLLQNLTFRSEGICNSDLIDAIKHLQAINDSNKRSLGESVPINFVPKNKRKLLFDETGKLVRARWEECLFQEVEKSVHVGDVYIMGSTRFDSISHFFIPEDEWKSKREVFFKRSGLPSNGILAAKYLSTLITEEIEQFNQEYGNDGVSQIENGKLYPPKDETSSLNEEEQSKLNALNEIISQNQRYVSLIEVCIEVQNKIDYISCLNPKQRSLTPLEICEHIAVLLAYATNTGLTTMSTMTKIPIHCLRTIANTLDDEALKRSLSVLVMAMMEHSMSAVWGIGKSSSSDGQKFVSTRKVLHNVFSHKLRDYGTEFYSFVADNFTPFHSEVIECNERDAMYIPSGLSGIGAQVLDIEEHFTDTHGYSECTFTWCALSNIAFRPRIRDIHKQRLYCLDKNQDTGILKPILKGHYIDLDNIAEQWDRIAHYCASIEYGTRAPNIGMKRIVNLTEKNPLYRAMKDVGRIYKTVHLLEYHRNPTLRKRITRGLNKGESIHSLGRAIAYGKDGKLTQTTKEKEQYTCSSLTIIEAIIIYWQTNEYERILSSTDIETTILKHISPVSWSNILIYGEYVFDESLIKTR